MEERRQYVRLNAKLDVSYAVLPQTSDVESGTKDVSAGGIRFQVKESLVPGTRARFEILLPGRQSIPFIGEIVWSDAFKASTTLSSSASYEVGVRIIEISGADREAMKRYVALNL